MIRVSPHLTEPCGLTPCEIERIVDHLTTRLEGFALPSVRGRALHAAIEIRLLDILQDLETERAEDLSVALNLELRAGTLRLPSPNQGEEDQDEENEYTLSPTHLQLANADARCLTNDGRSELNRQLGRALRERRVLPFTLRKK